ncbi:MAG: diguanylate cyclase [Rubrivivax sp.]
MSGLAAGRWLAAACIVVGLLGGVAPGRAAVAAPAPSALDAVEELALADPARAAERFSALLADPAVDALRARTGLALAKERAGDVAGARAERDRMFALGTPVARAAAGLVDAHIEMQRGSAAVALQALAAAQATMPAQAPNWLRQRLAFARANAYGAAGRASDAVQQHLLSIELADDAGVDWRRALMRQVLGFAYVDLGQLGTARALLDQALQLAEAAASPVVLAMTLGADSHLRAEMGDRDGARRATERALALAEQAGARQVQAVMLGNLADDHLRAGDPAKAVAYSERAIATGREYALRDAIVLGLANRGLARIALGQVARGKQDLQASLALDIERGDVASMVLTLREAGAALERAGDLAGAWDALARARPLTEQVVRTEQQAALLELQERFDRKQRERELATLDQAAQLQREGLRSQSLRARLWALAAAAAALTLGLVGWLAASVRRGNRALREVNAELQRRSEHDPLTGLANRRRLQTAMQVSGEPARLDAGVFIVDVDHFKQINDRIGHSAGDAVLIEVAERLRQAVRAGDLVVRWGGEEFVVVAQGLALPDVEHLAQRLLDGIAGSPMVIDDGAVQVTVSVGYARFPLAAGPRIDWEKAIGLVDAALYLAKADGRNRGLGVLGVQAADAEELGRLAAALASARTHGQVTLKVLQGPQVTG